MERWDIFCKVVDNYGDIGTCWRLARQLAAEHQAAVRLWVDRLASFAELCPGASISRDQQTIGPIEIRCWRPDFPPNLPEAEVADVVIESFGCDLPESYVAAMVQKAAQQAVPPVWINLEYLSAEDWVEGCHRLPSLRTRWPLTKYFFFPGFTPRTGGLLRERDLLARRAAFGAAAEAEFWRGLGIPPRGGSARGDKEMRLSLFCYHNAALPELLSQWADGQDPVTVLAPPGPGADQTAAWFQEPLLIGRPLRRSSLTVYAIPFLPQPGYDQLLWACDVNFVRGEDSFVRAQWAQRPLVWQIYPQTDEVHLTKLEAFLARYSHGLEASAAVGRCWRAWNGKGQIAVAWPDFAARRQALAEHGKVWASTLDQNGDLADNLVCFVRAICASGGL
jgi:uncharacterized repeat protein (TIGR03837 family)